MLLEDTRVLIVDDEPAILEQSRRLIECFVAKKNIYCSTNAVETMRIIETQPIELAFLDIEMPDANGFSLSEYIHVHQPNVKVVFLTGHVELGAKSFDYEPFDFLSKPIDVIRLEKTFSRYEAIKKKQDNVLGEKVAIDTTSGFVLISPMEISYIAKENRKTIIHCKDKSYVVQYSLDVLEAIFSDYGMFRIHQSFIACLSQIISVSQADFGKTYYARLKDGNTIPVSRGKYAKLREYMTRQGVRFM